MTAERDPTRLLAGMRPELDPGRYVCTAPPGPGAPPAGLEPVVTAAGALADAGLSGDVGAGFHRDHLFVEHARAERALAMIEALSRQGREAAP